MITQAQIAAAVWEVLTEWRAEMHDNVKHSLARRIAERIGHFMDRTATLTAEVGEWKETAQSNAMQVLADRNAELARNRESLWNKLNAADKKLKEIEAATIERCVQAAKASIIRNWGICPVPSELANVVDADLRALKG